MIDPLRESDMADRDHESPRDPRPPTLPRSTRRRIVLSCGIAGVLARRVAIAQPGFPSRPIKLVVAAPPGGSSDLVARTLANGLGVALGRPVIVENRPGASGAIAAESVARAAPDGHTLMLSWIGNATGQALLRKPRFDINRDFTHITQIVSGSNVLVADPSTAFHSLSDMIVAARTHPGRIDYASAGNGSSGHVAMEMLKQRAGIDIRHVPYRGGAPALTDVLSGQVPLMFINQDAALPIVREARVLALAITSVRRNALFPALPTVAESGFPGFEATAWVGLSAPRATPTEIVQAVYSAALTAIDGPMKAQQEALGAEVVASSPEQYQAFVHSETEKWARVIRTAGIQAD